MSADLLFLSLFVGLMLILSAAATAFHHSRGSKIKRRASSGHVTLLGFEVDMEPTSVLCRIRLWQLRSRQLPVVRATRRDGRMGTQKEGVPLRS